VEGRDDVSQVRNAENICELAKARSMVLDLWVPAKGNRGKMSGVLRRVQPKPKAGSK